MTPVLDDELRRVLRTWAAEVPVAPDRPEDAMTRRVPSVLDTAEGRHGGRRWVAAAAAAALVLTATASLLSTRAPTSRVGGLDPVPTTMTDQTIPRVLTTVPPGEVPMLDWVAPVVLRPHEAGWRLVGYYPSKERPFTAFTYRNDDGRGFELTVREAGCCLGQYRDRLATDELVRGHNARVSDDGEAVYMIWEEAGLTWMLSHNSHRAEAMSKASLMLMASNFEVVSRAENTAWLPRPLVEVLRTYPGVGEITWNGDSNYYLLGRAYPVDLRPEELPVR